MPQVPTSPPSFPQGAPNLWAHRPPITAILATAVLSWARTVHVIEILPLLNKCVYIYIYTCLTIYTYVYMCIIIGVWRVYQRSLYLCKCPTTMKEICSGGFLSLERFKRVLEIELVKHRLACIQAWWRIRLWDARMCQVGSLTGGPAIYGNKPHREARDNKKTSTTKKPFQGQPVWLKRELRAVTIPRNQWWRQALSIVLAMFVNM